MPANGSLEEQVRQRYRQPKGVEQFGIEPIPDRLKTVRWLDLFLIVVNFLINPGTILNDSPTAHLEHLKTVPTIEAEADRCIECGYCEPVCPSRELTTTPRQRIVLRREFIGLAGDVGIVGDDGRDDHRWQFAHSA